MKPRRKYCDVKSCVNNRGSTSCKMYRVPIKPPARQKWIEALGHVTTEGDNICNLHFKKDDTFGTKATLKPHVVPSIFTEVNAGVDPNLSISGSPCKTEQATSSFAFSAQSEIDPLQLERPEAATQILNEDGQIVTLSTAEETCARCAALETELQQWKVKYERERAENQRLRQELCKYGALMPPEAGNEMVELQIKVEVDSFTQVDPLGVKLEASDMDGQTMDEKASDANDVEATGSEAATTTAPAFSPYPFECGPCGEKFENAALLGAHMSKHVVVDNRTCREIRADKEYCCAECGAAYDTKQKLTCHLLSHREGAHFKCSQCWFVSATPRGLARHVRFAHGRIQATKSAKPRQRRQKREPREPTVRQQADSETNPQAHLRRKHPPEHCKICDEELLPVDTAHDCLGERQRSCEYCARSFDSLRRLMAHLSDDHDDTEKLIYVCDICRRTFRMRLLLEAHAEKHTRGSFACTKCPQVFDKKPELRTHMRRAHAEANHLCDACGKGFATKAGLSWHDCGHSKPPVKCRKCPYEATPSQVSLHTRLHHADRKSFTCHVCGKKFDAMIQLAKHAKIHARTSADRKFACAHCSYKTDTNHMLRQHIRRTHVIGRGHQCTHCDKSYKHKGDLTKHLREHLGDNLYKCADCPAEFRVPWDLRKHSFEHLGEQNNGDTPDASLLHSTEVDSGGGLHSMEVDAERLLSNA